MFLSLLSIQLIVSMRWFALVAGSGQTTPEDSCCRAIERGSVASVLGFLTHPAGFAQKPEFRSL